MLLGHRSIKAHSLVVNRFPHLSDFALIGDEVFQPDFHPQFSDCTALRPDLLPPKAGVFRFVSAWRAGIAN
ncbi:hypothetical protein [Roseobacter weihaiensis]|uniref:hypothetical protein n=1 Tax=Roseobacter weihaiensis TaxID=2763262 RepID=UPI001D0BAC86|nr:hypothetical protein [Roseobacter sp. H9]